jgi:integrase
MEDTRLADVRRPDLQRFVSELQASGLNASTVQTSLLPLRAIFREAVAMGDLAVNPCIGLKMPAVRGGRERFASPKGAAALLDALPHADRPVWATSMYAGLRRGELKALRWSDIDLGAGIIRVEPGWDDEEGNQETKGRNRRRVPIASVLRDHLLDPARDTGRDSGLVFGEEAEIPFNARNLSLRADDAWEAEGPDRITLHECRHSFASLMIAALKCG